MPKAAADADTDSGIEGADYPLTMFGAFRASILAPQEFAPVSWSPDGGIRTRRSSHHGPVAKPQSTAEHAAFTEPVYIGPIGGKITRQPMLGAGEDRSRPLRSFDSK